MSRDHHTKEEIPEYIRTLKTKHPTSSLSNGERAYITAMFEENDADDYDQLDHGISAEEEMDDDQWTENETYGPVDSM